MQNAPITIAHIICANADLGYPHNMDGTGAIGVQSTMAHERAQYLANLDALSASGDLAAIASVVKAAHLVEHEGNWIVWTGACRGKDGKWQDTYEVISDDPRRALRIWGRMSNLNLDELSTLIEVAQQQPPRQTPTKKERMSTDEVREHLGWRKPENYLESDGAPGVWLVEGHTFKVQDSGGRGFDSGRIRWFVECTTCGEVIHRGSTSAAHQITFHLDEIARKGGGQ